MYTLLTLHPCQVPVLYCTFSLSVLQLVGGMYIQYA